MLRQMVRSGPGPVSGGDLPIGIRPDRANCGRSPVHRRQPPKAHFKQQLTLAFITARAGWMRTLPLVALPAAR
jgi:hypothetical protein